MNYTSIQEAFLMLERMAALCATQGVSEETQKLANEHMQKILDGAIRTAVTNISAKSSGLVV